MLGAIENMKFFLRMGFGDSKSFPGGGISIKSQGLCQGNGAAPAGWAVISICILGAHGKKGHGAKFLCPEKICPSRGSIKYARAEGVSAGDLE